MLPFLLLLITSTTLHAFAFHAHPSHACHSSSLMASKPQHPQHSPIQSTPVPPPPPLSMPVWSLSCPISPSSSAMSIVTFATPISVSAPKLWAISLYKTSQTRCAFLGVARSGEEYNDIASTSSSVVNTARNTGSRIRRRRDETLAGAEGAMGWRARQFLLSQDGNFHSGTHRGVGVLQLLTPRQSKLVPILGKRTGWDTNYRKKAECSREMGLEQGWVSIPGSVNSPKDVTFEVLPNCACYIQLKLKRVTDGGDHDVAICEVVGTGVWDDENGTVHWLTESESRDQTALDASSALYTGLLRKEGTI